MKRREFLKNGLTALGAMFGSQLPTLISVANAQESTALDVTGAILNVHDPVMIKHGDNYYLFCTGGGVPVRRSSDMLDWRLARGALPFPFMPEEAYAYVPDATNLWAPDISFYNGKFHLYYSISTFGSNHSAIGLATNETLDPDADNFDWVDHGIVIQSDTTDFYNCIDANLILDEEDVPWLAFGSFWGGIKLVQLDFETGKLAESADDAQSTLHSLATREENSRSVEAPFIIRRHGYYYLFVSFDFCCRGIESTYNVRVGRSESVTGPYLDRDGVAMMEGGGTQITFPTNRYFGPGHNSIFSEDEQDYIVYHAYDGYQGGTSTLRIELLEWDEEHWPSIPNHAG
ncbi:MAG: arabinan endo-1,5-alpha-L-arabinosidase [Aggregatilineales bacterium]